MKKKGIIVTLLFFSLIIFSSANVYAAPQNIPIPKVNISMDNANSPQEYVDNIKLLIAFTVLALLPSFIIMMTSFTRLIVVFSFLRSAIGTQQAPPNQILVGLALFLTFFIMQPTYNKINEKAIQPYLNNKITQEQAIDEGSKPLRDFMLKTTYQKDLKLFIDVSKIDPNYLYDKNNNNKLIVDRLPLYVVVPAFVISELKIAFSIGFLLYIPFLIIDLVVASVLMSMGMFMLPPTTISLPFKLLLFVMVDGWYLLVKSLIMSFS